MTRLAALILLALQFQPLVGAAICFVRSGQAIEGCAMSDMEMGSTQDSRAGITLPQHAANQCSFAAVCSASPETVPGITTEIAFTLPVQPDSNSTVLAFLAQVRFPPPLPPPNA